MSITQIEELVVARTIVCAEVGVVAAGAAIGQVLIPEPILGAVVGSVAGQVLSSMLWREVQPMVERQHDRLRLAQLL